MSQSPDKAESLLREMFAGDLVFKESTGNFGAEGVAAPQLLPSSKAGFLAGPAPHTVCSLQAGYEVAPDEKRKECGQHLIEKYLKPNVSKSKRVFAACKGRTVGKPTADLAHVLPQPTC